jgi:predicted dehydrogenase
MRVRPATVLLFVLFGATLAVMSQQGSPPARLMVVDPGHFHASLLQREMYPSVAARVSVYAPLGPELLDYLNRVSLFNQRKENPTGWDLDVHTSSDPMGEMLREHPGNAVVFSGKNRAKIDRIVASIDAGIHVFADKPWIIASKDISKLERALDTAERKGLAAYDIMTERFEITSILQRELVNTPALFGVQEQGTESNPGVYAKSIHHVMKIVAGVPLRRPAWFFDTAEYGEGLSDVGTHVVDLVQWTAFPDQALDYKKDVRMVSGKRWPLSMTKKQFEQVTGEPEFPPALEKDIHEGKFDYYCNNSVSYALRGVHVKMDILWNWEAPAGGGDVYEAAFRGSKARVEIRQGAAEKWLPELYVVPANDSVRTEVADALKTKVAALQTQWPGASMETRGMDFHIVIPAKYRVGHEAHFAQVAHNFFAYMALPKSMPAWERPNMLAKYFISTKGVELGQKAK